MKGNFLNNGLC